MRKLFNPAVTLMNRLKYPQKFILISLLFVLPLALVLILLIPSINEQVDFARQEKDGNVYLRPLRRLLEHSLQNKMLTHDYLSGNGSAREALLGNQARLDEDFRALEIINQELGDTLKATASFQALRAQWQELKSKSLNLEVSASDELHNEFITAIRALISLVGNTSHLILDPDLDSYYLMDALLLKLPESQALLAQTRFLGEQVITQKSLTAEERAQLIVLAGLIQSNLKATQNGIGVAFQNNPAQNLKPILAGSLQEYSVVSEAFLETLQRELITPPLINPQSARVLVPVLASQTLAASFKLWDQTTVELDSLLQRRIDSLIRRKYWVGIVTALGLGLVSYLWVGFYLAVVRTISSLDDAAKRMVSGNTSQMVNLENKDELGQVALSFNEIATALVKTQAELEQRVEERTAELSRTNERLKAEIVERQQIEEALRESEEQLRLALEAAQMGIWNWNILTGAVEWSEQVEAIFGLAPGEFAGTYEAYLALVPPPERATVEQNIAETLAGARADYQVEHRFVWPNGSVHWLEAKGRVYRDEAGRPVQMTGTVVDITPRKQAEIALQESQVFLHNIYTGVGMAVFVIDVAADGTFRYAGVNPAYEQLVGLKSVNLKGRTPEDLIPLIGAEAVAEVRRNYEECLQTKQIIYKENHVLWQGQETWYLDQLTPIHDAEGRIIRIIGSTINITQIKQAEKALRQSQQQYETLVNSIDGIVWEGDAATFQFSFVSQQAERLLGYPVERWLTEPTFWADHIHPEDRAGAVDFCLAATAEKRDHEFEYRMITADARAVWLRDIVTVVVENNHPVKLQGIMVDVTQGKQAEQALNRYANRLEVLHEIDRAILAARSPEEIAQTALRYLRQLVPCRRAGLNLLDFETNEIVILAIDVEYETRLEAGNRLPFKEIQHIIDELRQGKVFVLTDIRSLPGGDILLEEGIRTGISLPLIANKALIGLVNLWSANTAPFSEEQVNISREVADQLAIAIQQARLFEAEAQRRQEAEALRDTAAALNSTLNLEEVLDRILSNVGRLVQHDMINIALIESGLTHVVRAQGYAEQGRAEAVFRSQHSLADTPILRRMVETGQPVVIPDTQTDPDWVVKDEPWLRSYAGIPIRLQGEVIGILNLDSDAPWSFTTADVERLQAFADQAAVAIKNAHLYAETKQRAEHLAVLHELDQAITASLDADHVYQAFAQQTLRLLPYDFMSINLVEGDGLYLSYAAGEELLPAVGSKIPLKALELSRWVIEQGQPFLSTNLVSEQRFAVYQPVIMMGMRSAMMLPLRVKGQVIGVWFLARRPVDGYSLHDLIIAQSVAEQLAIAIENTRLFEQVQAYTEELEQRVADRTRELSALYDVTAVASESMDLPTSLERSLERVLGAMRSQAGTIHLLHETGATLHLAVQQGLPPDLAVQLETLPASDSLPGWVIEHGDPLIVPDLTFELRSVLANRNSFQAYVGVPMRASGQVLGVLSVARAREQPQFKVEEVALLTTIADQVGVVVESARLRQQAEQSAVIEERARLARDLHDSVTQLLYSVNLFAGVGREAFNLGDMAQVNSCLAEVGQIAQQALKEMRLLVYELRPLALAQEGLVGALRQRLEAVERRTGVQAQLQAEAMLELPRQVEEAFYHIAQEALNNALKHATATAVTVSIGVNNGRIELEVADNGSGFDPRTTEGKGGLGLTSMRERVEKMGGVLTILSTPGEGTKVKVSLEV